MTLSPFGSTRTMSNDGAIASVAAGARGGSLPKPMAACRGVPASGPVRTGGLEAAVGKGIPAGPASCAFCPGSGGALTVPNQPRRETRPTIARTAMAARPRGRRANWLRSSITLTRHHRVRRVPQDDECAPAWWIVAWSLISSYKTPECVRLRSNDVSNVARRSDSGARQRRYGQ
jgi:hypothetical protein